MLLTTLNTLSLGADYAKKSIIIDLALVVSDTSGILQRNTYRRGAPAVAEITIITALATTDIYGNSGALPK